jgi:hypothetical protein
MLFVLTAPRALQAAGDHLEDLSMLRGTNRAALAINYGGGGRGRAMPANHWPGRVTSGPSLWSAPSTLAAVLAP